MMPMQSLCQMYSRAIGVASVLRSCRRRAPGTAAVSVLPRRQLPCLFVERRNFGTVRCCNPLQQQQQQTQTPPASPPISASTLALSSLRRQLNVLCVESTGRMKDLRMPVTQLRDESRLHMRELLILEQPSALVQARILPRRHCIVLTVGFIRALIFTDRVYLFSPTAPHVPGYAQALSQHILQLYGPDGAPSAAAVAAAPVNHGSSALGGSATGGSGALREDTAPFELVVMEHALLTLAMRQSRRVGYARRVLQSILTNMGTVERDDGRTLALFPLSTTLTHYEVISRGLCESIRALLEDDRDMREACLTEKARLSGSVVAAAQQQARSQASAYDPIGAAGGDGSLGGRQQPAVLRSPEFEHGSGSVDGHGHTTSDAAATAGSMSSGGAAEHASSSIDSLLRGPSTNPGSEGGTGSVSASRPLSGALGNDAGAPAAAIEFSDHSGSGSGQSAIIDAALNRPPEGSDAFLGHAASPIGTHRHLGRVVQNAAAADVGGVGASSSSSSRGPYLGSMLPSGGAPWLTSSSSAAAASSSLSSQSSQSSSQYASSDAEDEDEEMLFHASTAPTSNAVGGGDGARETASGGGSRHTSSVSGSGDTPSSEYYRHHDLSSVSATAALLNATADAGGRDGSDLSGRHTLASEDGLDFHSMLQHRHDYDADNSNSSSGSRRGSGRWSRGGGGSSNSTSSFGSRPHVLPLPNVSTMSALPHVSHHAAVPHASAPQSQLRGGHGQHHVDHSASSSSNGGGGSNINNHGMAVSAVGGAAGGLGGPAHLPAILRVSPDALSQLELMLESVYHSAAETVVGLVELSRALRSKTELLELQQSNYRNYLLSLSLRMSVLGVSVSAATFMTSAFGMNLRSGLETSPSYLFFGVTLASVLVAVSFYRIFESLVTRHSPTQTHARRLAAFQSFLWQLDARMDAAKSTISRTAAGMPAQPPAGQQAPGNFNLNRGEDERASSRTFPFFDRAADFGVPSLFSSAVGSSAPSSSSSSSSSSAATAQGGSSDSRSHRGGDDALDFGMSDFGGGAAPSTAAALSSLGAPSGTTLSKAQFKALHERSTGQPISQEEVDLLFELLDADADGKLRLEEALETFNYPLQANLQQPGLGLVGSPSILPPQQTQSQSQQTTPPAGSKSSSTK